MTEMASLQIRKRRAFSAVPDDILTNLELGDRACRILSWLLGRPENWKIYVRNIQSTFRLTDPQWRKVRRELEAAGFYFQEGRRAEDGTWRWINIVFDEPQPSHQKPGDGEPSDGRPSDGEQSDRADVINTSIEREKKKQKTASAAERQTLSLSGDKVKEQRDLAYAKRIGSEKGLTAEEIETAISSVRYPSQAPRAVEASIKEKARRKAEQEKAEKLAALPIAADQMPMSSRRNFGFKKLGNRIVPI